MRDKVCRISDVRFSDDDILKELKRYNIEPKGTLAERGAIAQAKFDIATLWPLHTDTISLAEYIDLIMEKYPTEKWVKESS